MRCLASSLVLAFLLTGCDLASGVVTPRDESAREDIVREEAPPLDEPDTYEEYVAERQRRLDRLDEEIGEATASGVEACRVVAVGEKACGGPETFRVYSAESGDEGAILGRAESVTALDRYANTRFELVSTCDVPRQPTPEAREGACRAR